MKYADDPLEHALRPLRTLSWNDEAHRVALRTRLDAEARAPRRRSRTRTALACAALIAALAAAAGSAPFLMRLFAIEVLDVQRGPDGKVERITVRADESATVELRPLSRDRDFDPPVVVTVPGRDGGELRLQVLRDIELELVPRYVPVDVDGGAETRPGARFAVRAAPCPWRAAREPERLVLEGDGDRRIELPRIPTPSGSSPRYGDERGIVEVLDR